MIFRVVLGSEKKSICRRPNRNTFGKLRARSLSQMSDKSRFPLRAEFQWARSRSTKVGSPGPEMEVLWDLPV